MIVIQGRDRDLAEKETKELRDVKEKEATEIHGWRNAGG